MAPAPTTLGVLCARNVAGVVCRRCVCRQCPARWDRRQVPGVACARPGRAVRLRALPACCLRGYLAHKNEWFVRIVCLLLVLASIARHRRLHRPPPPPTLLRTSSSRPCTTRSLSGTPTLQLSPLPCAVCPWAPLSCSRIAEPVRVTYRRLSMTGGMAARLDGAVAGEADGGAGASVTRRGGARGHSGDGGGGHGGRVGGAGDGAVLDDGVDGGSVPVVLLAAAPSPVGPAGDAPVPPPVPGLVAPAASAPVVAAAHGVEMGPPVAGSAVGGAAAAVAAPVVVSGGAGASVPAEAFDNITLHGQPSAYVFQYVEVRLAVFKEAMAKKTWPRGDAGAQMFLAQFRAMGVDWTRNVVTVDAHMQVVDGAPRLAALLLLQSEGHVNAVDRLPVRRVTRRDGQPLTLVDATVIQSGSF